VLWSQAQLATQQLALLLQLGLCEALQAHAQPREPCHVTCPFPAKDILSHGLVDHQHRVEAAAFGAR
jgi:hypothetical protein